jgi:uridine kinase
VCAPRPELAGCWDLRFWVDIDPELSVRRGTARDAELEGSETAAEQLHRDRYLASELVYLGEADPRARADLIVDNTDFADPRFIH